MWWTFISKTYIYKTPLLHNLYKIYYISLLQQEFPLKSISLLCKVNLVTLPVENPKRQALQLCNAAGLCESVFSVSHSSINLFKVTELQEMSWPVILMIIFPGCPELNPVLHAYCMLYPHEVVIPRTVIWSLRNKSHKRICVSALTAAGHIYLWTVH